MARRWTWEDEQEVLRTERTQPAMEALARRLNRTVVAVWVRRNRLEPLGRRHTRWTPAEDQKVLRLYAKLQAVHREMEAAIGRPAGHVIARAHDLAVRARRRRA